jgi:hypothetical protein
MQPYLAGEKIGVI